MSRSKTNVSLIEKAEKVTSKRRHNILCIMYRCVCKRGCSSFIIPEDTATSEMSNLNVSFQHI